MAYRFEAELWLWSGDKAAWHFLTVPEEVSDDIVASVESTRGFGSVRVTVTIGSTTWETSVFPDKERAAFVLPVKKAVRAAEDLGEGSIATVELRVI